MGNMAVTSFLEKALGRDKLNSLTKSHKEIIETKIYRAIASRDGSLSKIELFDKARTNKLKTNEKIKIEKKAKEYQGNNTVKSLMPFLGLANFATVDAAPTKTGLVLSGGGSMGSFQVGVLAYFYKIWQLLKVSIVSGTSVGSVNAIALSESGKSGILKLIKIWLSLNRNSDMYILTSNSTRIDHILHRDFGISLEDVINLKSKRIENKISKKASEIVDDFFLDGVQSAVPSICFAIGGAAIGGPLGLVFGITSIVFGVNAGLEISDGLNAVYAKKAALEQIISEIMSMKGYRDFKPLRKLIKDNLKITDLGKHGNPKLRMAMVCLEDGEIYYMTEKLTLLRGHADPATAEESWMLSGTAKDKAIDGVIASSSVPIFFPPVTLKKDNSANSEKKNFVDGGIREMTPHTAAIELGCDRIINVIAPPPGPGGWYNVKKNMMSIGGRTLSISLDEIARTDIIKQYPTDFVIQPEIAIIDAFDVDPGLIRINMDYGYMCAYDSTLSISGKNIPEWNIISANIAAFEIAMLRKEIWQLERSVLIPTPVTIFKPNGTPKAIIINCFNKSILKKIREKKIMVCDWAIARYENCQNDRDSIPISINSQSGIHTNISDWWNTWERHSEKELETAFSKQPLWAQAVVGVRQNAPNRKGAEIREPQLTLNKPSGGSW